MLEVDIRTEGSALVAHVNRQWKVSLFQRGDCFDVMVEKPGDSAPWRAFGRVEFTSRWKPHPETSLFDGVEGVVEALKAIALSALTPSDIVRGLQYSEAESHVRHLLAMRPPDQLRAKFEASGNREYLEALDRVVRESDMPPADDTN